jgi:Na+-driven multidrug efflux pump
MAEQPPVAATGGGGGGGGGGRGGGPPAVTVSLARRALALLRVPAAAADEFIVLATLALPIILTYLLGFLQAVIGQMLVGHVSAEALAAAQLSNMMMNALGMSVIIGCSSAVDTLASQAFGARNLPRVGHVLQRGVTVSFALCVPVSVLFLFAGDVLGALGQDPGVVELAGEYIKVLIAAIPALCAFEVVKKFLTNVGAPSVPLVLTVLGTLVNLVSGIFLVYFTPLGFLGAPVALVIGSYVMLGASVAYLRGHRAVHAAMRAYGLGALVPGSTLAESAAAAEAAAAAAAAAAMVPAAAAAATAAPPKAPVASAEAATRSLVAAAAADASASAGQFDDVLDSSAATAAPALAPAAAAAAAFASAPAAVDVAAPAAETRPPLPTDMDDILDATLQDFSFAVALSGWREYLALGMPSALMLFFEWASYEVTAVIAGLISINALATHAILSTTAGLAFMPMLGFGVATMIRIGNLLGARQPAEAKLSFRVALVVWMVYAGLNAAFLLLVAPVWGRVFTDDVDVDAYVTRIIWVLALYGIFDTGQCVLCFAFRGLGRPGLAAVANGLGYVVIGLPLAYTFGITLGGGVQGLWLGYAVAVTCVFTLLSLLLRCISFEKEAEAAYKRSTSPDAHATLGGH